MVKIIFLLISCRLLQLIEIDIWLENSDTVFVFSSGNHTEFNYCILYFDVFVISWGCGYGCFYFELTQQWYIVVPFHSVRIDLLSILALTRECLIRWHNNIQLLILSLPCLWSYKFYKTFRDLYIQLSLYLNKQKETKTNFWNVWVYIEIYNPILVIKIVALRK